MCTYSLCHICTLSQSGSSLIARGRQDYDNYATESLGEWIYSLSDAELDHYYNLVVEQNTISDDIPIPERIVFGQEAYPSFKKSTCELGAGTGEGSVCTAVCAGGCGTEYIKVEDGTKRLEVQCSEPGACTQKSMFLMNGDKRLKSAWKRRSTERATKGEDFEARVDCQKPDSCIGATFAIRNFQTATVQHPGHARGCHFVFVDTNHVNIAGPNSQANSIVTKNVDSLTITAGENSFRGSTIDTRGAKKVSIECQGNKACENMVIKFEPIATQIDVICHVGACHELLFYKQVSNPKSATQTPSITVMFKKADGTALPDGKGVFTILKADSNPLKMEAYLRDNKPDVLEKKNVPEVRRKGATKIYFVDPDVVQSQEQSEYFALSETPMSTVYISLQKALPATDAVTVIEEHGKRLLKIENLSGKAKADLAIEVVKSLGVNAAGIVAVILAGITNPVAGVLGIASYGIGFLGDVYNWTKMWHQATRESQVRGLFDTGFEPSAAVADEYGDALSYVMYEEASENVEEARDAYWIARRLWRAEMARSRPGWGCRRK